MDKEKELKITIGYQPVIEEKINPMSGELREAGLKKTIRGFTCSIEGSAVSGKYDFYLVPEGVRLVIYPSMTIEHSPFIKWQFVEDFRPIAEAIQSYHLTQEEAEAINGYLGPFPIPESMPQEALQFIADLLTRILEGTGYIILEIEKSYFPSPTSIAIIAPVFSLGLQKEIEPIDRKEVYGETVLTYLSYEKPQSKAALQLRLLDNIPKERLSEIEREFKGSLTPYGLKTLYLVIEECGQNKRSPWFYLDTNRCLDLMGYKRTKLGWHQATNKDRFIKEIQGLTRINFNIEKRSPKKGKKDVDQAIRFITPLLSITGKFEEYEVAKDRPIAEGVKIREGMQIFIHDEIYKFIDNLYTFIPHGFLKIDIGRSPHAVALYSYIANQWRIGWAEHNGIIKASMRTLLDGAGLLARLPKRKNQQRDFVEKIRDDLQSLKNQKEFWIKSIRFDTKNKALLDQIVTIEMADGHPLQTSMRKQITNAY